MDGNKEIDILFEDFRNTFKDYDTIDKADEEVVVKWIREKGYRLIELLEARGKIINMYHGPNDEGVMATHILYEDGSERDIPWTKKED